MTSFLGLPVYSDAARRGADAINMHISAVGAESFRKWVALRMSDGGSDGNLYESRREAISHQLHPTQCCYLRIGPFGQFIQPMEVEAFLTYFRSFYDAGGRIHGDPDAPDMITPLVSSAAPGRGSKLALPYRGEWK